MKQDINAWEAGKSIPTGQQIVTMENVLGVKLPRPNKHHWFVWVLYMDVLFLRIWYIYKISLWW